MYINSISLENVRTFAAEKTIYFNHPDRKYSDNGSAPRKPKLKNVNLLFGQNASGKTTVLEAIALASLGPAISDSRISPRPLVRFLPKSREPSARESRLRANIRASLSLQDSEVLSPPLGDAKLEWSSELTIAQRGELESFEHTASKNVNWEALYQSTNESFFIVAYGATRRVDPYWELAAKLPPRSSFMRGSRIESIVQEGYPLVPLQAWPPQHKNGDRWNQVVELINKALGSGHFEFKGEEKNEEYYFSQGGLDVPFRSLSDGYRAFLGWIVDLLFHLSFATEASQQRLDEVSGIVLVDEIDVHLHPKWQMEVVGNLSRAFPKLQFIFTSHSPLIAGSVEWMNITHLQLDHQHRTGVKPFDQPVHGLDADQILLTDLFGLKTTRARAKDRQLDDLTRLARSGDDEAAKQLIAALARGTEEHP